MKHFSLVVIGGGSGGLEAAYNAATLYKAKVAVVDVQMRHGPPYFSALGGTCVNVGCVPKKLFYTGALYRDHMRDAEGFGWGLHADEVPHNWEMMIAKKNTVVQGINDSYQGMFKDTDGLEFFVGKGTFVDTHTLSIQDPANAANELHRITVRLCAHCHRLVAKNAPRSWHRTLYQQQRSVLSAQVSQIRSCCWRWVHRSRVHVHLPLLMYRPVAPWRCAIAKSSSFAGSTRVFVKSCVTRCLPVRSH